MPIFKHFICQPFIIFFFKSLICLKRLRESMIKLIDDTDIESEWTGTEIPGPIKMNPWIKSPLSSTTSRV